MAAALKPGRAHLAAGAAYLGGQQVRQGQVELPRAASPRWCHAIINTRTLGLSCSR